MTLGSNTVVAAERSIFTTSWYFLVFPTLSIEYTKLMSKYWSVVNVVNIDFEEKKSPVFTLLHYKKSLDKRG